MKYIKLFEDSNLKLKDIGGDNVYSFLKTLTVSISDEDFDNIIYIIVFNMFLLLVCN